MELAGKAVELLTRAGNNNIVINTFLLAAFGALSIRSVSQQRDIETLESEKTSLLKTNKALKKTMWDWKQELFADAASDNAPVPLSKLKLIYGEATTTTTQPGPAEAATSGDSKSPPKNFVV